MDEKSLAPRAPYVLRRVHAGGTEAPVGEHQTFGEGWSAGTRAVTVEDREHAYALYQDGRRVARFGFSRLAPRFVAERLPTLFGMVK